MNFWNRSILFVDWVWDFPPPQEDFSKWGDCVHCGDGARFIFGGWNCHDKLRAGILFKLLLPRNQHSAMNESIYQGVSQWSWTWSWHHGFHKPCWFLLPPKTEVKFYQTRQKPPYGCQGLAGPSGKDAVRQVQFGVFSTSRFGPPSLRGEVVIVQESFDNSCQWRYRLRTPWRLWAQTLTSMANAWLNQID